MRSLFTLLALLDSKSVDIPHATLDSSAVQNTLRLFFGLAGSIAFLVIIISGFRYTISHGDSNAIKQAKESIIYALIGLVVCMAGYGIVTFVLNKL